MKKLCLIVFTIISFAAAQAQTPLDVKVYKSCANNVKLPIEDDAHYHYSVQNGRVSKKHKAHSHNEVILTPYTTDDVYLVVKKGEETKYTFVIKVLPVPLPSFFLVFGDTEVAQGAEWSGELPSGIDIQTEDDSLFEVTHPNDAYFKVDKVKVSLKSGNAVKKFQEFKTHIINLHAFSDRASDGDELIIEIKQISHYNFEGLVEVVSHFQTVTFKLTIKR